MFDQQDKKIIFYLYLSILYIFFLIVDKSFSPDYIAYFHKGNNSEYYFKNQFYYAPLFSLLLNLLWNLKYYHTVINVIYSLSFFLFSLSILNYSKYFSLFKNEKFYIIFVLFIICSIHITFEFFMIRLRAGLSLSLMLLSFSFLLNKRNYLFMIFSIISLLIHTETSLCFMYVSAFLLFFSRQKIKKKYFIEILLFFLIPTTLFFLSYFLNYSSIRSDIGFIVEKPLNFYRLILYIIPIFFFIYYHTKKNFLFIDSSNYLKMYITNITFLCFSILFISITPIIQFAGEDIHRFFSIFTLPIIFLIMSKKNDNFLLFIWFYFVSINFILFFKNFLYLIV